MPYDKLNDLPDAVKGNLPKHGQEIYLAAFNAAIKEYNDESKAAAVAWAAVKNKYEKQGDKWVAKESTAAWLSDKGKEALAQALKTIKEAEMLEVKKPDDGLEIITENLDLTGDFLSLVEANKGGDTIKLKIIQPGWGSAAFYPADVLERDAAIYRSGTQMFWDHQTEREEKERPEGSLTNLAGVLVSDGKYKPDGPAGPGVYADAKVFSGYKDAVAEMAPHIGVSHRAGGLGRVGKVEGKEGKIVEKLTKAVSVDFVTLPGAGGKVLQLFEAARGTPIIEIKEVDMTVEQVKALEGQVSTLEAERDTLKKQAEALVAEVARFREGALLAEAAAIVASTLKEAKLPDVTKERLSPILSKNPPVKDGKLDGEALKITITEAVKAEAEYLSKLMPSGQIQGMGSTIVTDKPVDLEKAFERLTGDPERAKVAARGR